MTTLEASELAEPSPLVAFERPSLFLDLDGTLADIRPLPQDVKAEPWRSRLLQSLQTLLDGRLAVVSGRTLAEVDAILEHSVAAVAAVHGLVRRTSDGEIAAAPIHPGVEGASREARDLVHRLPGLRLELKGPSLALHYRQAPELAGQALDAARTLADRWGLRVQPGDMVVELCTPGHDKGSAILDFMRSEPFKGSVPVFLGDDLTDEAGFKAVRSLGGVGVLVGPRPSATARWPA